MSELPTLINDLALILIVASIVTLLFKKLKQPLVLGYVVAGFLVSPHMPYTMSVIDNSDIKTWADIGVMFLLFSLGLDFSFKKILKMGMSPIIAACTIIFFMMTLGIVVGHAFSWARMDCIFLGGMLAMSSTTIIYKALDDMGLRQQKFAGMVMSVLILEDILAIVMMVVLAAIAEGSSPDGGEMIGVVMKIGFFLVLWFVVGIFLVPLFLRSMRKLMNGETLLIVALGLCCFMAVLSTKVGFSSAFGAFVMGSILAETIEAERIIKLVEPVKNLFGAIFFVSVGMLVDPNIIVAQIGEFSFIIASLGLSLGVIGKFLYPVVVAVSVITTFLTPYMMKASVPCYNILERRLPKSWVKAMNNIALSHPAPAHGERRWRSLLLQMTRITLIYSILSSASIAVMFMFFLPFVRSIMPGMHWWANGICALTTVLFISPFLRAIVMKKNHSEEFKALWSESRLNHVPLIVTILVRIMVATAFVFYICNYLTRFTNALMISIAVAEVLLMMISRRLKRRSIMMERMFILNLRSRDIEDQVLGRKKPLYEGHLLDRNIHIGNFDVPEDSLWSGQCLNELKLRNRFGVMVSSILRGSHRINIPNGTSEIFPGDRIQVIGSDDQLAAFGAAIGNELMADDPDIEKREMKLRQMVIDGKSVFVGKTLAESGIRDKYNCMVVGLEEGKENLSLIEPSRRFVKGDIIWIVGEESDLQTILNM